MARTTRRPRDRKWIPALILAAIFLGTTIYVITTETGPKNPAINVHVANNVDVLQNVTISCSKCAANDQYKWVAYFSISNEIPFDVKQYANGTGSVELNFGYGVTASNGGNSKCPAPAIGSVGTNCVYPLSQVPFSFSFNIAKTSNGGVLEAKIFLANGDWYEFQTGSGQLSRTINFQQ